MSHVNDLGMGALLGAVLGLAYCLALWWHVRRLVAARHPGPWLAVGALLRIAVVGAVLYGIAEYEWLAMIGAAAGFVFVRTCVVGRVSTAASRALAADRGWW